MFLLGKDKTESILFLEYLDQHNSDKSVFYFSFKIWKSEVTHFTVVTNDMELQKKNYNSAFKLSFGRRRNYFSQKCSNIYAESVKLKILKARKQKKFIFQLLLFREGGERYWPEIVKVMACRTGYPDDFSGPNSRNKPDHEAFVPF